MKQQSGKLKYVVFLLYEEALGRKELLSFLEIDVRYTMVVNFLAVVPLAAKFQESWIHALNSLSSIRRIHFLVVGNL